MRLNALIVEDEYLAREELTYLVEKHSIINIVAAFDDGLDAFKFLQSNKVDIVFLDINVPSIDGMLLARNIAQFSHKPQIVFTTAYKEYAVDAFELEAVDYLLKPLNEQRIIGLLAKLQVRAQEKKPPQIATNTRSQSINLMLNNHIHVTAIHDICCAIAHEKVTHVYTTEGCFVAPMTISELMLRLPVSDFFRCHRSYCININNVKEIIPWVNSTYMIKMDHVDQQIPVSRSNLKAFRSLMQL
ncbi:LytR/AlgR family response regulator transcription factor [Photobacterium iliopiscarium]|uniref:LytR/AlgR family response regulator transcription factor n=1 Tax=Photobacterium iliopiscarium TaxID=56192 RepID=UPI0005D466B7|nr:LytTR family DNA-binding domain-containing protein [Photobacterium iliopiscarium]KJG11945.1 LytTR family transcriptional regulator [Photobacterium iliopiscarium]PSU01922.1 DNA-binding response regulator [Photobacterium iliopiscarium]PSV84270.1 DNA-binding response regulator [Photobacterium iliopiscarium]